MKALVTVHWQKIIYYRTFWLLLLALAGALLLGVYGIVQTVSSAGGGAGSTMLKGVLSFPAVWQSLTTVTKVSSYFFSLLIVLMVCNDVQSRQLRQHVIDGLSRESVVLGYLGLSASFALFSLLVVFLLAAIFGERVEGQAVLDQDSLRLLGCYTLACLGIYTFAYLVASLFRRSAVSIILFLLWVIIVEPLTNAVLEHKLGASWAGLMPMSAFNNLVPAPAFMSLGAPPAPPSLRAIAIAGVYPPLFGLLAWLRLRFSDL